VQKRHVTARDLKEDLEILETLTWSGAVSMTRFHRTRAFITTVYSLALSSSLGGVVVAGLSGFLLSPEIGVPFCVLGSIVSVFAPTLFARRICHKILVPILEQNLHRSIGSNHSFAISTFEIEGTKSSSSIKEEKSIRNVGY